jgi:alpha/beta superfamily hydrolase
MTPRTVVQRIAGPVGLIECALDAPEGAARGVAVVCHPHPQYGGTMDNKVVQTVARALVQLGWRSVRFNFRGIGRSEGNWDEGRGEVDDALAVLAFFRAAPESGQPCAAGRSAGVAATVEPAARRQQAGTADPVGPSTKQEVPKVARIPS